MNGHGWVLTTRSCDHLVTWQKSWIVIGAASSAGDTAIKALGFPDDSRVCIWSEFLSISAKKDSYIAAVLHCKPLQHVQYFQKYATNFKKRENVLRIFHRLPFVTFSTLVLFWGASSIRDQTAAEGRFAHPLHKLARGQNAPRNVMNLISSLSLWHEIRFGRS